MRTIHKFALTRTNKLHLPADAKPLCVQNQRDVPCLWVELDTDKPTVERWFMMYGTGNEMPPHLSLTYIGTVQALQGDLILHVYEVSENP